MASEGVQRYGVNRRYETDHDYSEVLEELYFRGYSVVNDVLGHVQINGIRKSLDDIYAGQLAAFGGSSALDAIGDLHVARAPLLEDPSFAELALNPVLRSISEGILGENFVLLQQNGLLNPPATYNFQAGWHRDLSYQHWVSSKPLAFNALFCIDDFTLENGCTFALAGSHLRSEFPTDAFIEKHEIPLTAPAGSVVVMDAMLYHRAGHNRTENVRRGVNHLIGLPFMTQQISLFDARPELVTDDFTARFFGKRWRPAEDAISWRNAKRDVT